MSETKRVMTNEEDFIVAHESSSSADEVSIKTGMKVDSINARASKLRNRAVNPVPLKHFPRKDGGARKTDTLNALKALAAARGVSVEQIERESNELAKHNATRNSKRELAMAN